MTFSTVLIDNDETGETEAISANDEIIIQVIENADMLSDIYGQEEVIKAMMVAVTAMTTEGVDIGSVN